MGLKSIFRAIKKFFSAFSLEDKYMEKTEKQVEGKPDREWGP